MKYAYNDTNRCDRCNKEIYGGGCGVIHTPYPFIEGVGKLSFNSLTNETVLCDECLQSFKDWLMQGES